MPNIFETWQVEPEEIARIIEERPSLRGVMVGYLAEYKLRKLWFPKAELTTPDDHDRKLGKGDFTVMHKGVLVSVQVKSLQSTLVKKSLDGFTGLFQCDASDRRPVRLPNGEEVETTCLVVGGFDLLAVNLFEFGQEWRFAFARNESLPRTTSKKYTPTQQQYLLKSGMPISWPLKLPYETEPFRLLDEIVTEKKKRV